MKTRHIFLILLSMLLPWSTHAWATCETGERKVRFGVLPFSEDPDALRFAIALRQEFQNSQNGLACIEINRIETISPATFLESTEEAPHIVAADTNQFAGFVSVLEIFNLPFAFRDTIAFDRFVTQLNIPQTNAVGASTIGAFPVSVMQMSAKLSLTRPEAATGLRFRRKPGTAANPMVGLLKATDIDIAESALLKALKEGKADAQFATWKSLNEANTASVQNFVVETNHRFSVRLLLTNKEWQDSLPAGFRTRFDLAYRRAMAAFNRETLGNLQKHKAAVLDKTTVLTLTRKQHNAWRQVVETLWEDYVANADNAELLKRLERANRL